MMKNRRFLLGIGLISITALLIGMLSSVDRRPPVSVRGYGGGSKAGLLGDPDVQKILADHYRLHVAYDTGGSLDELPDDEGKYDFLWPGNEVALERYRERHAGKISYDVIFSSPVVFYSWAEVTDALVRQDLVEQIDGTFYATDVPGLMRLLTNQTQWKDLGLTDLYGRLSIIPTNPARSNSGNVFAAYMANMLSNGQVVDERSIEGVLPEIKTYFDRLGRLEESTGRLFQGYVTRGKGAYPIIVAYESQMIELVQAAQGLGDRAAVLQQVRVIYPRPTVWASHPIIAQTAQGKELAKALQDPEIQRIAWKKHGFRSALIGVRNDPADIPLPGVPAQIASVLPLPGAKVMDRLTAYLGQ